MKTCDEMVNSLLKRREQYLLEQKQKRKTAAKIAAAGGSCTIAVIGVLVLNSGMLREKKTAVHNNSSAITDYSSAISVNSSSENDKSGNDLACDIDPSISPDDIAEHLWNGKIIKGALYKAFDEYDDEHIFKVSAFCSSIDNFEYDNIEKYIAAIHRPTLLKRLIEYGDELKYGEALCTTGTSEGITWTKELYDDTVSFIGKELIDEYIVDGEFLKDRAERDYEAACNELETERELYEQAFYDYMTLVYGPLMKQLQEKGISCELTSDYTALFIDISKNDLANLTLDDPENWRFQLVKTNDYY